MPGIGDPVNASIRSTVNSGSPVTGASRDDLQLGDVVGLYAVEAAATYAWSFLYKPEGSAADFSGSDTDRDPGTFTVDLPGSYLIQLTINAGTAYESSQAVRLRRLTDLGQKFPAAGEFKRSTGSVPVDASEYGWTDDLNANLSLLEASISVGSQGPQGFQGNTGSQGAQGAGVTYASGIVGSDTTVTLDALNFQLPSSGNFSLKVAAVSGTLILDWSSLGIRNTSSMTSSYYTSPPGNPEITTSYTYIDSSLHLNNIGMAQIVLLHDRTNSRFYRIHAMTGPGFTNNPISIERLV